MEMMAPFLARRFTGVLAGAVTQSTKAVTYVIIGLVSRIVVDKRRASRTDRGITWSVRCWRPDGYRESIRKEVSRIDELIEAKALHAE